MAIEQGQIYEVMTDNFMTSGESNSIKRPAKLLKGEKIEIRYPYEWHFRTEDNQYFHARSEMIYENCKLIGRIIEQVRFNNKAKLKEILELELYNKGNLK